MKTPSTPKHVTLLAIVVLLTSAGVAFAATTYFSAGSGTAFGVDGGPEVGVSPAVQIESGNPVVNGTTVNITTKSSGYVVAQSSVNTSATVAQIEGSQTKLDSVNVSNGNVTIITSDKPTGVKLSGNFSELDYKSASAIALDDGTSDFAYTGNGTLTLTGHLPASTPVSAVDMSSDTVLGKATTDGSGQLVIQLDNPSHTVELVTNEPPSVDNASATPSGGAELESSQTTLEINASDPNFPDHEDSVDVTFWLDGQQKCTDTLTSNGTATCQVTITEGGSHHWGVNATDGDLTTDSDTFTIKVPSVVKIRNETSPYALINNTASVEVIIAGSQETVTKRTVSDGKINMTGLNASEKYIMQVDAEDYYERTVYVSTLYEQTNVFLLNKSMASVENRFLVVDNTGQYNAAPKLLIQKPINESQYDSTASGYRWITITGDRLGATNSMTTNLERNGRYRIKIVNQDGDIRSLGEYRAQNNGTRELPIGTIEWESSGKNGTYRVDAWETNTSGTRYLKFAYSDPTDSTSELTLRVHERNNVSNTIYTTTVSDLGNYTETVQLPANGTFVANYTIKRDGKTESGLIQVGEVGLLNIPIEGKWLTPMVYLMFVGVLAMTPKAAARTGAVVVVAMGTLAWWFGWAPISGPALGIAGALALVGKAADFSEEM